LSGDEYSGAATLQRLRCVTGIGYRLIGRHQQEALPRIHDRRLAFRDVEKIRIESSDVGKEATPNRLARGTVRMILPPKPAGRALRDQRGIAIERLPEFIYRVATREKTRQSDNGNRLRQGGIGLMFWAPCRHI